MANYMLATSVDQTFTDNLGQPLVAGSVEFFVDTARATPKPVFEQTGVPGAYTYVQQGTNGVITLNAGGKIEKALYYYPYDANGNDELYYVIVKDSNGATVETREGWPTSHASSPGPGPGPTPTNPDSTKLTKNIVTNGQFAVNFQTPGNIMNGLSSDPWIASGWLFQGDTKTTNVLSQVSVASENLNGSPEYALRLVSTNASPTESSKEIFQNLGPVNMYEGKTLTFQISAKNNGASGTVAVEPVIVRHYGPGISDDAVAIGPFNVTTTRTNYSATVAIPAITKTISDGNFTELQIEVGKGINCDIEITNVLLLEGSVSSPVYPQLPYDIEAARGLSEIIEFPDSQVTTTSYTGKVFDKYIVGGKNNIITYNETGKINLGRIGVNALDELPCDGRTLSVSSNNNYVEYRRLYNVLGNVYGGQAGGAIVAKAAGAVVTFDEAGTGAWQSAPTIGTMGTTAALTSVTPAYKYGVNVTVSGSGVLTFTWTAAITPVTINPTLSTFFINGSSSGAEGNVFPDQSQFPLANYPRKVWSFMANKAWYAAVNAGSTGYVPFSIGSTVTPNMPGYIYRSVDVATGPAPAAVSTLDLSAFAALNESWAPVKYSATTGVPISGFGNYIEFQVSSSKSLSVPFTSAASDAGDDWSITAAPGSCQIVFQQDGAAIPGGAYQAGFEETIIANYSTKLSFKENMDNLAAQINNPYQFELTVNTTPAAGTYFTYHTTTAGYYVWFQVNGAGADPAPVGLTSVLVSIGTGASATAVAAAIALAVDTRVFALPTQAELPAIPAASSTILEHKIKL